MKFGGGLYATNYQSTTTYGLGTVSGDSHTYATMTAVDANKHVQVSYEDALGRIRYIQTYSGLNGGTLTANMQQTIQYNALDKSVSLAVTDLALSISATTTANYDDLGRMTSLADPDRGTHTSTYDADGRQLTDVSGTRTIGTSYDLLGRIGCIQDAAPTTDGSGICSSGSHPLVQNTYDVTKMGTSTTDFPLGQLTQSVATTYYNLPTNTNGTTVTEQFQHDQRGQLTASTLQISVPSGWNVTTPLPTYQQTQAYNDANQPMTTQTTVGGSTGYTFSQAYDSTTGQLTGLSNNSTGVANLATLGFNASGLVSDLNFQTTTGTALANDHLGYDNDLRPQSSTATWQSGSGSSGTIFSNGLTYDPVGNMTSASTTHAAVPGKTGSGGSEAQNFCYNEQNRLVWAGNTGSQPAAGSGTCGSATLSSSLNGASYNSNFVYTNLGQISQAPLNGSGAAQYYLYCNSGQPHQLTGVYPTATSCASASGATYSASYDSWGNMTSRTYAGVTATLTYDGLDHLVKWDAGTTNKAFYAYDASGNRVLLRSTTSSTTITTYPFGLEEHTYGSAGANKSNTYYYTLGNRLIGELTGTTTLNTQFFLTDTLGSILATFNATAGSAAVQGNQLYGPYGNQRYNSGTMGTSKGYTGQYADPDGLDYYNARYYDPVVGVFLSADVVQGNAQGMNPYAYVGGNPETYNDPTGQYFAPPGNGGPPPTCGQASSRCQPVGGGSGGHGGNNPPPNPQIRRDPLINTSSGSHKTDQRARETAFELAQNIAALRALTGDDKGWDYAMGTWYLTDQNNNGNFFLGADALLGYHPIPMDHSTGRSDPLHSTYAEQRVLMAWLTNGGATFALLALKLAWMAGVHAVLHIVLFTELPACDQCKAFFSGTFASGISSMGTAIMNGPPALNPWPTGETAISLDVYAKNPKVTGGNWLKPIVNPSELTLSYWEDIPFISSFPASPPAGAA